MQATFTGKQTKGAIDLRYCGGVVLVDSYVGVETISDMCSQLGSDLSGSMPKISRQSDRISKLVPASFA